MCKTRHITDELSTTKPTKKTKQNRQNKPKILVTQKTDDSGDNRIAAFITHTSIFRRPGTLWGRRCCSLGLFEKTLQSKVK